MSFSNLPQAPQSNGSPSSPSTPHALHSTYENGKARSPLREQFPVDVRLSPPAFTHADAKQSPSIPRPHLDTSDTTLHDRHNAGRSRSASSSDTHPPQRFGQAADLYNRERSKSPMRLSITLDRPPARTSSRADLRSDTTPPNFSPDTGRRTPQLTTEGRMSPSLNVPNGTPLSRKGSFDSRHRSSTSSLGQMVELPPRPSTSSGPTSPSHRVDVPHGVESGPDTDAEGEEDLISQIDAMRESLAPPPPPKETKGVRVGTRPPQLKLDSSHVNSEEHYEPEDTSQLDSAEVSEEYLQDEEPVESTSHATFIAPALPPIRFSMGGADFADLLKSVGGPESLKLLDKLVEGEKESKPAVDVTVTPPPTAAQPTTQPTTPTGNTYGKADASADATPVKRREPPVNRTLQSPHSIAVDGRHAGAHLQSEALRNGDGRPSFARAQSSDHKVGLPPKPRLEDQVYVRRERVGSNASLAPNGSVERIPRTQITVTSPDNAISNITRPDTADLARRRLQEALAESTERGAPYVKLDAEFIGAIIMLLDQRKEEFLDLKRKLDGMRVSVVFYAKFTGANHIVLCSVRVSSMLRASLWRRQNTTRSCRLAVKPKRK